MVRFDRLVLHSDGTCLVSFRGRTDGRGVLEFLIPQAMAESLYPAGSEPEGAEIVSLTVSIPPERVPVQGALARIAELLQGREVTVSGEDGPVTGTFLGIHEEKGEAHYLLLSGNRIVKLPVRESELVLGGGLAREIADAVRAGVEGLKKLMRVRAVLNRPNSEASVAVLSRLFPWRPSYRINLLSGDVSGELLLELYAEIRNETDTEIYADRAELVYVRAPARRPVPRLMYERGIPATPEVAIPEVAPKAEHAGGVIVQGFDIGSMKLLPKVSTFLRLLGKRLEYESVTEVRVSTEATVSQPRLHLRFKNDTGVFLPEGEARLYVRGSYHGLLRLPETAPGRRVKLEVGPDGRLEVKADYRSKKEVLSEVAKERETKGKKVVEYIVRKVAERRQLTIWVRNVSDFRVRMLLKVPLGDFELEGSSPKFALSRETAKREKVLEPKGEKEFILMLRRELFERIPVL